MLLNKYKLVEGIGQYWNRRYEVQEKYSYYENGKKVTAWHTVFHSSDKKKCEEALKKYEVFPQKNHKMPFIDW